MQSRTAGIARRTTFLPLVLTSLLRNSTLQILAGITLLSATLFTIYFIYAPGLDGGFALDDTNNLQLARISQLDLASLHRVATNNQSGLLGRPISALTFSLDSFFRGHFPYVYKQTNVLIHLLNGLLLFLFLYRIVQLNRETTNSEATLVAGTCALLWLLHPLNVSTTLYVVQRMTQLSFLFSMIAMLTYVVGRQAIENTDGRNGLLICLSAVFIFTPLSALSKENGALTIVYLLLIEIFFFRSREAYPSGHAWKKHLLTALLTAPIVAGASYFFTHTDQFLGAYNSRDFTLEQRLLTESRVMILYLKLILLPSNSSMTLNHDYFPISEHLDLSAATSIVILALLILAVFILRKKLPVVALGISLFLTGHLLESTILPLELVFEHRNYLPTAGILLAVVALTGGAAQRMRGNSRLLLALIPLVAAALAYQTYQRASLWGNPQLLAAYDYLNHPDSPRANIGMTNLRLTQENLSEAILHLKKLSDLRPLDASAALSMIRLLCPSDSNLTPLLQEANQRLLSGRINPETVDAIRSLVAEYHNGGCPALSPKEILGITSLAANNPFGGERPSLQISHSINLESLGYSTQALDTLTRLYETADHKHATNKIQALTLIFAVAINLREFEKANWSRSELAKWKDNPSYNVHGIVRQLSDILDNLQDKSESPDPTIIPIQKIEKAIYFDPQAPDQ